MLHDFIPLITFVFFNFPENSTQKGFAECFCFFLSPKDISKQEHTKTCNGKQAEDPTKVSDNSFSINCLRYNFR